MNTPPRLLLFCFAALFTGCGAAGLSAAVKKDLEQQLSTTHKPIAACYEAALARDAQIAGKVMVKFKVHESSTTPTSVEVSSSDVKDAELTKCIVLETQDVRLTSPPGVPIAVTYPLELAAAAQGVPESDQ